MTKTEIQLKDRKLHMVFITIGLLGFLALSVYSAHLLLNRTAKAKIVAHEGVRTTSVVSAPSPVAPIMSRNKHTMPFRDVVSYSPKQAAPSATMNSTSMHVYQTSNARVHTYGSGGGNGQTAQGGSSSQRGIRSNAIAAVHSSMIYIPKPHNPVTEVGATSAAGSSTEGGRGVTPRTVSYDPQIPFPDPVGGVPFALMALLSGGYILTTRRKN